MKKVPGLEGSHRTLLVVVSIRQAMVVIAGPTGETVEQLHFSLKNRHSTDRMKSPGRDPSNTLNPTIKQGLSWIRR